MSDYIDWYDDDAVEKLQEKRTKKYIELVKAWHDAKEKGEEEAMKKAFQALQKHKGADKKLKEKAEEAGSYWY